jgi:hypothetical protein
MNSLDKGSQAGDQLDAGKHSRIHQIIAYFLLPA